MDEVSPDVVRFNTGYNTVDGYVAGWVGIAAADGSFTVRSENAYPWDPNKPNRSYGMEGFMLAEVPEPGTALFLAAGLAATRRRSDR